MRKILLASAALCLLLPATAKADVIDPLHGYAVIAGVNTNTDNGTISPIALGTDSVQGFGFFASPAPLTDTLRLVVLEPGAAVPVSVTGNVGGGTLFSPSGTWSSGDLAAFLGLTPSSPANPFDAFASADTANPGGTPTSFHVFTANLGTQTELSLMNSTMLDNIIGGIVPGAEITAFSTTASGTVSTAPSGVLMQTSVSVPGPIVGAGLPGIVMACIGMVGLARRRIMRRFA